MPKMAEVVEGSRSSFTDKSRLDMIVVGLEQNYLGVITNSKCNSCVDHSKLLTLLGLYVLQSRQVTLGIFVVDISGYSMDDDCQSVSKGHFLARYVSSLASLLQQCQTGYSIELRHLNQLDLLNQSHINN